MTGAPRTRLRLPSDSRRVTAKRCAAAGTVALVGGLSAALLVGGAGPASASPKTAARTAAKAATPALVPQAPSASATPPIGTPSQATDILTNPTLGVGTGNTVGSQPSPLGDIASPKAPSVNGPSQPNGGTVTVGVTGVTGKPSQSLMIIILLTVISVAPALLVLCTSFTKIMVVLSLTRNALGLQSIPPNQVLAGLALFLSMFIMGPVLSKVNHDGVQPYLHGTKSQHQAWVDGSTPLKAWMLAQTRKEDLGMLNRLQAQADAKAKAAMAANGAGSDSATTTGATSGSTATGSGSAATGSDSTTTTADTAPNSTTAASTARATDVKASTVSMTTLVPAFVLSELKSAFIIGFVIFIPFLVIDIVVSSSLMSMGMAMVPPVTVSLPFKILLFLMVDGWGLILHSIVTSYH